MAARMRPDERRAVLLAAAAEAFAQAGYADASVADVAALAGVSEPLVFRYFPTKAELHAAVVRGWAADLATRQDAAVAAVPPGTPVRDRVRALLEVLADDAALGARWWLEPDSFPAASVAVVDGRAGSCSRPACDACCRPTGSATTTRWRRGPASSRRRCAPGSGGAARTDERGHLRRGHARRAAGRPRRLGRLSPGGPASARALPLPDVARDHAPMAADHETASGHVIVHGLEGLGLRVVEHLVALDVEVVAIDDGARPGAVQAASALGATVVQHVDGAGAALDAAGLREARAVVCLSSTDLGALEIALLVRRLRPELPVIAQIRNPAVARAIQADAGVLVLDVAAIAAPAIVEACLGDQGHGLRIDDEVVQVRTVTAPRDGVLRDLFGEALVPLGVRAARRSGEPMMCPGRDLEVVAGDQVSMLGPVAAWDAGGAPVGRRPRRPPGPGSAARRKGEREPAPAGAVRRWGRCGRPRDRRPAAPRAARPDRPVRDGRRAADGRLPRVERNPDDPAGRAVLHCRDGRHDRLRRLQLPRAAHAGCGRSRWCSCSPASCWPRPRTRC